MISDPAVKSIPYPTDAIHRTITPKSGKLTSYPRLRLPQEITSCVSVFSETAPLLNVVVGFPTSENYDPASANPINLTARKTINGLNRAVPLREAQTEFKKFIRVLEAHGVQVSSPKPVAGLKDQIYTRDPGGVVGCTFVPARMTTEERRPEPRVFSNLMTHLHRKEIASIKVAPQKCRETADVVHFEFGDIFTHGDTIYIGESERTNSAGIRWFKREFGKLFKVVSIKLKPPTDNQEALHLDCAFNLVGTHDSPIALLHLSSFEDPGLVKRSLPRNCRIIEVSDKEQAQLGTNLLSINHSTVVVRDVCVGVNEQLQKAGITTIPLAFNAAASMGGLFRCCTMPLARSR